MKKIILIIFAGLFLAGNIRSQSKKLTENEYDALVSAASRYRFDASRREIKKFEEFKNGVLTKTTMVTYEVIKPDKEHNLSIETSNGKTEKIEIIVIGKNFYQRKNDGAWMRIKEWWYGDGIMTATPGRISTFTVEDATVENRPVKLYTALDTYRNEYLDKNGLSFTQIKNWIADDKFLLKEEVAIGVLETKKLALRQTYNYEYNIENLKIETPIIKTVTKKRSKKSD